MSALSAERPRLRGRRVDGAAQPAVQSFDVGTWDQPHRLIVHRRDGAAFVVMAVWLFVIAPLVESAVGPASDASFAARATAMLVIGFVPIFVIAFAWAFATLRYGTLMFDRGLDRISLEDTGQPSSEGPSWGFGDVVAAEPARSAFSDAVKIVLGTREILVRVPKGKADEFATTLLALTTPGTSGAACARGR